MNDEFFDCFMQIMMNIPIEDRIKALMCLISED